MAAATIIEHAPVWSCELHIFEKNSILWNKVLISGGGRCNVTTGYYKKKDFGGKYIRGSEFLEPAMAAFGPRKVYQWFEEHGVPLKLEKDMRVFPVSNKGRDVVAVFEKLFAEKGVLVHFKEGAQKIDFGSSPEWQTSFVVKTNVDEYVFDMVVLTTGGNAYAHTGSSGEWYNFAQSLGHSITPLGPSLNSFQTSHEWMHALTGLSFPWARLQATLSDGPTKAVDGPVLLTHFGISGPNVFALSALLAFEKISVEQPFTVTLIPEADTTRDMWVTRLEEAIHSKKNIWDVLKSYFPQRVSQAILMQLHIQPDVFMSKISVDSIKKIAHFLSGGRKLQLTMRRPGDEFVTAGGVCLDEINPETMESKLTPWCYFAGEILDVDGLTGGFNLQACWAAGRLAGQSIVEKLL